VSPDTPARRVLFVCVENSNRSQMAEAFAKHHATGLLEAWSAGSLPSGTINPRAVASMRERGIDLSTHRSKSLSDVPQIEWDWVITMGCGDACPFVKTRHREDWALPDPKDLPPPEFAAVRDEIESRVLALLETMKKEIETHG
jgi:arsenate reductase (thioredoxin)